MGKVLKMIQKARFSDSTEINSKNHELLRDDSQKTFHNWTLFT